MDDLCRLTVYVTDRKLYEGDLRAVGEAYRRVVGRHFPAMALVEVAGLLEPGAVVEIEATAALSCRRISAAAGPGHSSNRSATMIQPTSFRYQFNTATSVATITLDRPERLNAPDPRRLRRAQDDLRRARHRARSPRDPAHRRRPSLLLGRRCRGDHRQALRDRRPRPARVHPRHRRPDPVDDRLPQADRRRPERDGGGRGAVIAAACDVRIAAPSAKIAFLFTKVGLSGADMGARGCCRASSVSAARRSC